MVYTLPEAVALVVSEHAALLARASVRGASVRGAALLSIAGTVALEDGAPNHSLLIRIATALDNDGEQAHALTVVERALRLPDATIDDRIRALTRRGRVQRRLARYAESIDSFVESQQLADAAGEAALGHYARLGLAKTHWHWANYDEASAILRHVISVTESATDNATRTIHAEGLWDLSIMLERRGRLEESAGLLLAAIRKVQRWSDRIRLAHDLGVRLRQLEQWELARQCLSLAMVRSPEWQTRTSALIELLRLATETFDEFNYARFSPMVNEATDRATGSQRIDALDALSDAEWRFGGPELAHQIYKSAIEEAMRQGHQWWIEKLVRKREFLAKAAQRAPLHRRSGQPGPELAAVLRDLPDVLVELQRAVG